MACMCGDPKPSGCDRAHWQWSRIKVHWKVEAVRYQSRHGFSQRDRESVAAIPDCTNTLLGRGPKCPLVVTCCCRPKVTAVVLHDLNRLSKERRWDVQTSMVHCSVFPLSNNHCCDFAWIFVQKLWYRHGIGPTHSKMKALNEYWRDKLWVDRWAGSQPLRQVLIGCFLK
jgi:hypothetical protein